MKINERNLRVFATTPPYDIEGFLNKRGEVNKSFQRRYFVLKGNLLFYFEKKTDKEPLGLIIVEGCTIELSEESSQYCFEIAFNGNRTYILSADTQESMELWMKALTCAGYEYKRLIVAELQRQLEEIEGSRNKMLCDCTTSADSSTVAAPKPPPRRQNPFNRPAPPVPASVQQPSVQSAPLPFINGHFNNASAQQQGGKIDGYGYNGTQGNGYMAKSTRRAKYEFFVQRDEDTAAPLPLTTATTTVFNCTNIVNSNPQVAASTTVSNGSDINLNNQNGNASIEFEQLHEKFREVVMHDINLYHSQKKLKSQPLIQL